MSNNEKYKSSEVEDQFAYHCNECQHKYFTTTELSSHIIIEYAKAFNHGIIACKVCKHICGDRKDEQKVKMNLVDHVIRKHNDLLPKQTTTSS